MNPSDKELNLGESRTVIDREFYLKPKSGAGEGFQPEYAGWVRVYLDNSISDKVTITLYQDIGNEIIEFKRASNWAIFPILPSNVTDIGVNNEDELEAVTVHLKVDYFYSTSNFTIYPEN